MFLDVRVRKPMILKNQCIRVCILISASRLFCFITDLTDDGMEVLALEFSGIVKLDISGCSRITDEAMDSFARHSENMRWLKLSKCPQISEIAVAMVKERYPYLTIVNTSDVEEATGKFFDSIF